MAISEDIGFFANVWEKSVNRTPLGLRHHGREFIHGIQINTVPTIQWFILKSEY